MSPTMLLLHADDTLATLLTEVLAAEGYGVERAATPLEALALLTRHTQRYGLILAALHLEADPTPETWLTQVRAVTAAPLVLCGPWPAGLAASQHTPGHPTLLPLPLDLDHVCMVVASLCPLWQTEQTEQIAQIEQTAQAAG